MRKNTAGKWIVFASYITDGTPRTGDAGNITANLWLDGVSKALDDAHPMELEKGYYIFDISAEETNGDCILICPSSTTENTQVTGVPVAMWTEDSSGIGTGDTTVNQDTGGVDNLRYVTAENTGIDNALIQAFLKSDYDASNRSASYVKGRAATDVNGRWANDMKLDSGNTYTIQFYKQGEYGPDVKEVTI